MYELKLKCEPLLFSLNLTNIWRSREFSPGIDSVDFTARLTAWEKLSVLFPLGAKKINNLDLLARIYCVAAAVSQFRSARVGPACGGGVG